MGISNRCRGYVIPTISSEEPNQKVGRSVYFSVDGLQEPRICSCRLPNENSALR